MKSNTTNEILTELQSYGDAATKRKLINNGAREPVFGVRGADLKKIVKRVKKDHALSMELFATGNSDAMYLAGLIADEDQISKSDLTKWVDAAYWPWLSEFTVPWVASESKYGWELGLKWIESRKENVTSSGWATLAWYASIKADDVLDLEVYSKLLDRVEKNVHKDQNRVSHTMNAFVIAVGSFIKPLTKSASATAKQIGKVEVDMGATACKVPLAVEAIRKVADRGDVGKKRKSARC
ncbi:MAG: DNA alkylation repair protein [Planctomycetota bacterium]|nr:DNA alkylation repair protein [Planctomycetota bacterium]